MRFFWVSLFLWPLSLFGATGDITSVTIPADGWFAEIVVEGFGTGGTYDMGLWTEGTDETGDPNVDTAKIILTATSVGYDDTGSPTTIVRTVRGTRWVRTRATIDSPVSTKIASYPKEEANGGNVKLKIALSDYLYDKDDVAGSGTDVTYTIAGGFYTDTATPNNSASGTVTNNSTVAHSVEKVVGNWSYPPYQQITGMFKLRAVAFHRHAQDGRPVRAVRFSATDGTTTVFSNYITQMTIDPDMAADAQPTGEYVGLIDPSTLDDDSVITCNFIAYPWVGDSGSILDTSAGTAGPTALYGPQLHRTDLTNDYHQKAKVTTGGDDGAGVVYSTAAFVYATATPFLTISGAFNAGATWVELENGNYAWLGATGTYGASPTTWDVVKAGPSQTTVTINAQSGDDVVSNRTKVEGITITATTSGMWDDEAIWFDGCTLNTTGTQIFPAGSIYWVTHSDVPQVTQGLRPFGTANVQFALVRGNDLTGFVESIQVYTVIGNYYGPGTVAEALLFNFETSGATSPYPDNCILYNNKILDYSTANSVGIFELGRFGSRNHGAAFVQNLLEVSKNPTLPNVIFVAASETVDTNTPQDNIIHWHNTILGGRSGHAYNTEDSGVPKYRRYWSVKNLYIDVWGIKTDTHDDPDPPNGTRVHSWTVLYGVGFSGNVDGAIDGTGPTAAFEMQDPGLSSYQKISGAANSVGWADFVDEQRFDVGGADAGNGDYHAASASSPLVTRPIDWVLPFDLDGEARYQGDSSGVFTYGVPGAPTGLRATGVGSAMMGGFLW